jgi:hypothetical protein
MTYPTLGREQPRREATCTKCGHSKMPTRRYLALLKSQDLPYVCKACRESVALPPMSLGKLGAI